MEPIISEFSLIQFLIQESHISRKPIEPADDVKIEINPKGVYTESENLFQLSLEVNISEPNKSLDISLLAVGIFEFRQNIEKDTLSNYFIMNAPAIIFPFVRSYIASLSSLSGMETILIPIVNMSGIQTELRERIEVIPVEKSTVE